MKAETGSEITSIGITGQIFNLTEDDLRNLQSCFISREIAEAANLRRVSDETGAEIVGKKRRAGFEYAGLIFPYFLPIDYAKPRQHRLRRDKPDFERTGNGKEKEVAKYLGAYGAQNSVYFPPNVKPEWLKDLSLPVVLTEGEKKALALSRLASDDSTRDDWRFLPLALSGVWNFRSNNIGKTIRPNGERASVKGLIPDFELIEWNGRDAFILFDANVQTNSEVMTARFRLAEALQSKGAIVYFVDLPQTEGINGIDDLLGKWDRENGTGEALRHGFELIRAKYRFTSELQSVLFGGKLKLTVSAAERGKCKVSAKDARWETVAVDSFNISENEKRAKFIKQINLDLTAEEKTEISRALIKLAEVSGRLFESDTTAEASGETVETSFQILKDGRIIEQIRGGFAMYDAETGEHSILETVTDSDGTTYAPIDDELLQKRNGIQLADDLTEYETEALLIADIAKYLSTYLDLKPLQLKLTALYILFTYIFDSVLELSYLNATGDAGSGKSRFGQTVCIASHRGLSLITPSAASLYRIVDKFKPTLFIDEFNSDANSDDAAAIIQILNAGFQQTAQIPRQVSTPDGKFKTEMFDAFCPKIIGSLKQSKSSAFNSRCIEIQMERTSRNDIPLRLSHGLLNDAQRLRNKLTLWRLRNVQKDFEAQLDRAETELKKSGIMPRSIQINIPLYALINDTELKRDFIKLLKGRDESLNEEKQNTLDGQIVQAIHTVLFRVDENAPGKVETELNFSLPSDNELCEELRLEKLLSIVNGDRPSKNEISSQYFGKMISGLGLRTKKILHHSSEHRTKRAIIFDLERLCLLFRLYDLPVSPEFNVTNVTKDANPSNSNGLTAVTLNGNNKTQENERYQDNCNNNNTCGIGNISNNEIPVKPVTNAPECSNCGLQMELTRDGNLLFCPFGCQSLSAS